MYNFDKNKLWLKMNVENLTLTKLNYRLCVLKIIRHFDIPVNYTFDLV